MCSPPPWMSSSDGKRLTAVICPIMATMTLWPFLLLAAAAPAPDKIVFDTDCGFFGDDGSALAMVLRSPENVQVTAITTVSGNVWAAESAGFVTEILGPAGTFRNQNLFRRTDAPGAYGRHGQAGGAGGI
jgi:hypothetical protein